MFTETNPGSLLIQNGLVLTLDGRDTLFQTGDLLIRDGLIERIAPRIDVALEGINRLIDARDHLVMPGLINAHVHSYENLYRGVAPSLPNELWNLLVYPPSGQLTFPPRLYYLRAMLGAIEMVKSGVTTIQDNSSGWFLSNDDEVATAYWQAYADIGVRVCVAVGLLDRTWLQSMPGLGALLPRELLARLSAETTGFWAARSTDQLIAQCEIAIKRWHRPQGRLSLALAPSAPQRCSDELLLQAVTLAERHNLSLHTHLLETRIQSKMARSLYGTTFLRHLQALGFLRPRTVLVHTIWLSDEDIDLLAETGCSVIHCPLSNLRMGSGVMPLAKLRIAGVPIGLGADGTAGSDVQSMFAVMYQAALLSTLADPDYQTWPTSDEILRMATLGSARTMLSEAHLGSLEIGKKADVLLLSLKHVAFTPLHDVKNQLVWAKPEGAVRTVIIDGQVVVENGELILIDELALLEEVHSYQPMLQEQLANAQLLSQDLWPYVDEMYRQAAGLNKQGQ